MHCSTYKGTAHNYGNGVVTDLASCQRQCETESDCIGISYSLNSGFSDWCYVCTSDDLVQDILVTLPFGFYRKPGKWLMLLKKQRFIN